MIKCFNSKGLQMGAILGPNGWNGEEIRISVGFLRLTEVILSGLLCL